MTTWDQSPVSLVWALHRPCRLGYPEQVRGTLVTTPFSGAKREPRRRGRGCVCRLGGGGAPALPGSRRGGARSGGGDARGLGRGRSSVSHSRAAYELGTS